MKNTINKTSLNGVCLIHKVLDEVRDLHCLFKNYARSLSYSVLQVTKWHEKISSRIWIPESKVASDGSSEETGARIIASRNWSGPNITPDQSLGIQLTQSRHPRSPQLLKSKVIILAVRYFTYKMPQHLFHEKPKNLLFHHFDAEWTLWFS